MKYLTDYIQDAQTKLFERTDSFFAFGQKQFDEQKKEGRHYVNFGCGLFVPKKYEKIFEIELDLIIENGIKQDLAENGKKNIIHRELANHECQISMDITNAVNAVSDYGITKEEVAAEWKEYFDLCVKNDWF